MSLLPSNIPALPSRPLVHSIGGTIHRSYPVGRLEYSRVTREDYFKISLTIDMDAPFRTNIMVNLATTLNSPGGKEWSSVPFVWADSRTLICQLKAPYCGLFSFRAEFSLDDGNSWMRDMVEDAWILVDPPQVDGLCMYTLLPNISGTIKEWITDLKRIKAMGFNAIHLLPLTTLDISQSPYSAKDLFSIDPSYLSSNGEDSLEQLAEFVEAAKEEGIKLCFDLVLNHVGVNSYIAKQAPDWIIPDPSQSDGLQRAKYLSDQGWCFWEDLVLINYNHPSEAIRAEIWEYMTAYMLFWAKYADYTGGFVRFDNLHSSNPAFIKFLTQRLNSEFPCLAILAEYFADEKTLIRTGLDWRLNLTLATPWDYKFVPKLREYLKYTHRLSEFVRFFMPVTSHDSGTPAQEFCSVDATVPRYVTAALMGTGATGIVQGVEYGVEKKIEFIGHRQKMQFPDVARFGEFFRRVNGILSDYKVFRQPGNLHFEDVGHDAIIAAFRNETEGGTTGFLVACNFDIMSAQKITIDLTSYIGTHRDFQCLELISGEMIHFNSSVVNLVLPPCSAQVIHFPKL